MAEGEVAGIRKSLLVANSIIKADEDHTPLALSVPASRLLGRAAAGGIDALTATEALTLLNAVARSLFGANSILKADTSGSPESLTIAASRIVGRAAAGGIAALTPAQILALLTGQAGSDFSWNTHKLTNVVDPTADQDAATKKYVDDNIPAALGQGARARRSTHQSIQNGGAYTPISFSHVDYDNDSMWDVGDPTRLTFTTAGLYLIIAQAHWDPHAVGYRGHIIQHSVNGAIANALTDQADANNLWRGQISTTWECQADEYVEFLVYQNSGIVLDCKADGYQSPILQAVRIGP